MLLTDNDRINSDAVNLEENLTLFVVEGEDINSDTGASSCAPAFSCGNENIHTTSPCSIKRLTSLTSHKNGVFTSSTSHENDHNSVIITELDTNADRSNTQGKNDIISNTVELSNTVEPDSGPMPEEMNEYILPTEVEEYIMNHVKSVNPLAYLEERGDLQQ